MKNKAPRALLSAALATALLAGCSSTSESTVSAGGSAAGGGGTASSAGNLTFTLGVTSDPGTVSPYETTLGTAKQVIAFGYDTLINQADDGTVISGLAEKWSNTANSATYTLKDGVTCADGSALTATDVADAFRYISDPKTLSPWLGRTIPTEFTVASDDAARTVTFTTKEPFGQLLYGAGALPIVCPKDLKNPKNLDHAFGGTGPYQVGDYVAGDHYTLTLRPDYAWGPGGVTAKEQGLPSTVTIKFIANASTAANEMVAGNINAAQILGPDGQRVADSGADRLELPAMAAEIHYNHREGRPTNDIRVRQALTMVLPMDDLVGVSTHNTGTRATNLMIRVPVLCPGDVVTGVLPQGSKDDAAKLLDEAGWTLGQDGKRTKDGKPLTLTGIFFGGQDDVTAQMELMAATWAELGVTLTLKPVTNAVFSQTFYGSGDWDVAQAGLNQAYPFQMISAFDGQLPPEGLNAAAVDNAEFQALTRKAMGQAGAEGCGTWNEAWKALIKAADVIPISSWDRGYFVKGATMKSLAGLYVDPMSIRVTG